jgi:hypothetical protein
VDIAGSVIDDKADKILEQDGAQKVMLTYTAWK